MNYGEMLKELAKQIVAKSATVIGTAFIAANGFPTVWMWATGQSPSGEAVIALGLVMGYAVWSQAIVPLVNAFFVAVTTPTPTGKKVAVFGKPVDYSGYFKLV